MEDGDFERLSDCKSPADLFLGISPLNIFDTFVLRMLVRELDDTQSV